ncbi:MAG: hypothetical protein ABS41_02135 [Arenimonas sp. SCN 70-307]|uniref:hypothetical protein n=1 Tax=Arenimonas sp. SCN 70-307 TaxID=1660089 RepID=UPI00086E710A|nr:hypothetical protein [Arenimonas sp. SCN 70-307]ODS64517.1 MAG: hypothetical protein ABS41_02135 [Arenimonas sp. SCN 70-307]
MAPTTPCLRIVCLAALLPTLACADGVDLLELSPDEPAARGRISVGFQSIRTDGNVDGSGNATPGVSTDTRNLLLSLDYRLAERWSLQLSIPFVDKRSVGDPGVHNVAFLAQPRQSAFIDDGDWHGAWQDWQLGVTHHGHWRGLKLQPHAVLTWPSHDYVFFASAAPGRRLRSLRLGADIGRRFGRSNLHWSLGYGYEFVEEVLDYDLDRQHYRASLRWDVSPSWSLSLFSNARQSQGIKPSDLAGRVPWSELWYQHDRLLRHNYVLAGIGAGWRINDDWSVSGSSAWPVEADSMHRIRHAWELQLSRSF